MNVITTTARQIPMERENRTLFPLVAKPLTRTELLFIQITSHLAMLEDKQGNYTRALAYMEMWKTMSPSPDAVQKRIDELREKIASGKTEPPSLPFKRADKTP